MHDSLIPLLFLEIFNFPKTIKNLLNDRKTKLEKDIWHSSSMGTEVGTYTSKIMNA